MSVARRILVFRLVRRWSVKTLVTTDLEADSISLTGPFTLKGICLDHVN